VEPYIDPLIRLGNWLYDLTLVSVTVNIDNISDMVLMNIAHTTVTGSCTSPGCGSTLRKDDALTYKFCGSFGRPISSAYIFFEIRRSDNREHADKVRYFGMIGWRVGRFKKKPRLVSRFYRSDQYALCTQPDMLRELRKRKFWPKMRPRTVEHVEINIAGESYVFSMVSTSPPNCTINISLRKDWNNRNVVSYMLRPPA
jgi:hypothetical protein